MARYELQINDQIIPLHGHERPRSEAIVSVPTSRRPAEPLDNPAGLLADAERAAERVALDLLALDASRTAEVEVIKVLADGTRRVETRGLAVLDPRGPGRAIVSTSTARGLGRSVPLAAIVETSTGRTFSHVVAIAEALAEGVSEGLSEDEVAALLADAAGITPHALRSLARHGVAAASYAARLAREGREPIVALAPSTLVAA